VLRSGSMAEVVEVAANLRVLLAALVALQLFRGAKCTGGQNLSGYSIGAGLVPPRNWRGLRHALRGARNRSLWVVHATYELECRDDAEARERARQFLEACPVVEVWATRGPADASERCRRLLHVSEWQPAPIAGWFFTFASARPRPPRHAWRRMLQEVGCD
jgi:hypothetical protein